MDEKKKLYHPVIFDDDADNPELQAINRTIEEKKYYVLYYNPTTEGNEYEEFIGRTACYRGIERILETYSIDAKDVTVLVEVIGIDRQTKKYRWFLMNPDDAKNAYDFCRSVEELFGDTAFDVGKYTDDDSIHEEIECNFEEVNPSVFNGDDELASGYATIMASRQHSVDSIIKEELFKSPEDSSSLFRPSMDSETPLFRQDITSKEI